MKNSTREDPDIQWFGIRTIFHFGIKDNGINVFEERIVVFSGITVEEAFNKAKQEGEEYVKDSVMKRYPLMDSYTQDGDTLIDGCEVWSMLYESKDDLETFVNSRYKQCEFKTDDNFAIRTLLNKQMENTP